MTNASKQERTGDEVVAELVALSARIDAALQRQLALIREIHERELWFIWGVRTCAQWLAWRLGLSPGAARERLRVALALGQLPKLDRALAQGRVSFSKVRAMTRVATPENEAKLLECALHATAAQLERICRGMRLVARQEEAIAEGRPPFEPRERRLDVHGCADGTAKLTMVVHRDEAAQVLGAIDRVRAALRDEAGKRGAMPDRADALVRMAALAVEALTGQAPADEAAVPSSPADKPDPWSIPPSSTTAAAAQPPAKAATSPAPAQTHPQPAPPNVSAETPPAPRACTGADHALVSFHLQPEAFDDGFVAVLDDGSRVPAETFRRVSCDCALTATVEDERGQLLDVGRRSRTISPALRRALARRDDGCRFPGCTCNRYLHAHHVEHWSAGGETRIENLLTLCPFHHRLVHEGGFTIELDSGGEPIFRTPVFGTRGGRVIPHVPPSAAPEGDLHQDIGPLRTDGDPDANLFWLTRRPDYRHIVATMVQ